MQLGERILILRLNRMRKSKTNLIMTSWYAIKLEEILILISKKNEEEEFLKDEIKNLEAKLAEKNTDVIIRFCI